MCLLSSLIYLSRLMCCKWFFVYISEINLLRVQFFDENKIINQHSSYLHSFTNISIISGRWWLYNMKNSLLCNEILGVHLKKFMNIALVLGWSSSISIVKQYSNYKRFHARMLHCRRTFIILNLIAIFLDGQRNLRSKMTVT